MSPANPVQQIEQPEKRASATVALVRALVSVIVCGGAFVAFLITPLALVVIVCGGLWWAEWVQLKRRKRARRPAPADDQVTAAQHWQQTSSHVGFGGQSGRDEGQL
jgi:hypothetical protein